MLLFIKFRFNQLKSFSLKKMFQFGSIMPTFSPSRSIISIQGGISGLRRDQLFSLNYGKYWKVLDFCLDFDISRNKVQLSHLISRFFQWKTLVTVTLSLFFLIRAFIILSTKIAMLKFESKKNYKWAFISVWTLFEGNYFKMFEV